LNYKTDDENCHIKIDMAVFIILRTAFKIEFSHSSKINF